MPTLPRRLGLIAALVSAASAITLLLPAGPPVEHAPPPEIPATLGEWAGVTYHLGPEVRAAIPEADFLTTEYRTQDGRLIDFAVLTVPQAGDLHDPDFCFQSQGWEITQKRAETLLLGDTPQTIGWCRIRAGEMYAQALYAFVTPAMVSTGDWRYHLESMRLAAMGRPSGPAHFVRVLYFEDEATFAEARRLLRDIWPRLKLQS